MKMKLLPAVIATASLLNGSFAFAAIYQGEISAAYGDISYDNSNADGHSIELEGEYYFSLVDTKNHPLAEAAFIEKSSSVYVQLGNEEIKAGGQKADIYSRLIGVDFYIPDSIIYLGAGVAEFKANAPSFLGQSYDWESSWFIKAGVAPIAGLLVWSEFVEDIDITDEWNINGKYVLPLSGEQALNFEAGYEKSKLGYTDDTISLAADYYIDRNLSIGTGFTNTSYANGTNINSTNDYFVRARNFFTDNISVELAYTDGDTGNNLMLGGTIRF